jgi:hypothetical protein
MSIFRIVTTLLLGALLCIAWGAPAAAAEEGQLFSVSEGQVTMKAPTGWTKQQPRVRMIEAEFSIPAVEGDEIDGRCTVMAAGGSVRANIDRWVAQFAKTDRNRTEKKEIAGQEVHLVDLAGIYKDQRGPFAPAELRENYRVLGAIIVTQNRGQYFVKFYGPRATVSAHEKAFLEMLNSLQVR